jgi:hypothetical protein
MVLALHMVGIALARWSFISGEHNHRDFYTTLPCLSQTLAQALSIVDRNLLFHQSNSEIDQENNKNH